MKVDPHHIYIAFAAFAVGRVLLHLLAMKRDHLYAWHLAGIRREFKHK